MRTLVFVVALSVVVGGCEKASKDRVGEFDLKVLDKGSEPRFALRYDIAVGTKQTIDMILDMDMSMTAPGMPGGGSPVSLPRMILVTDLAITDVDKTGAMDLRMTTSEVRVEDRPSSVPGVTGAMQTELEGLRGMRVTATLTPNGRTRDVTIDESTVSEKLREQMQQTEQMVGQMTTFLPDAAVGKGARWKVQQTILQQGMKVHMSATYELLEVDDKVAKVKSTLELTAPAQTIEKNGLAVKLEKMTATGGALSDLDFTKMVERVQATINMDMRMSAMDQEITAQMSMAMQILPSGQKALDVIDFNF